MFLIHALTTFGLWVIDAFFIVVAVTASTFVFRALFETLSRQLIGFKYGYAELYGFNTGLVVGFVATVWSLYLAGLGSAILFMIGFCALVAILAALTALFFPGQYLSEEDRDQYFFPEARVDDADVEDENYPEQDD